MGQSCPWPRCGLTTSTGGSGGRYPLVFLAVELQTALLIVAATLALFTFYYDGDTAST